MPTQQQTKQGEYFYQSYSAHSEGSIVVFNDQ